MPRIARLIFPIAIVAIGFAGIFVRLAQPAPPVVGPIQALGGIAVLLGIALASLARTPGIPQPMPSNGRSLHHG